MSDRVCSCSGKISLISGYHPPLPLSVYPRRVPGCLRPLRRSSCISPVVEKIGTAAPAY